MIEIVRANNDSDLQGILKLQKTNHKDNVSVEEAEGQGFLSVIHTFKNLHDMNQSHQHIVAKDGERVVGYALCMLREFAGSIPMLAPMFETINKNRYKTNSLIDTNYMAMGQVCVDKAYRGQGIFNDLYNGLKNNLSPHYDLCLTEVASRNKRSMRAHKKVGFKLVEKYISDLGESWNLIVWDWQ